MADRPIVFSSPMVRALLDGRKTQTRRVLKPQPFPVGGPFYRPHPVTDPRQWMSLSIDGTIRNIQIVPYAPGDRLYVREAFRGATGYDAIPPAKWGNKPIWYVADGEPDEEVWWHLSDRRHPSIHMPRWASRLTLTVTDVRVQRVQDISAEDCTAEGIPFESDALAAAEWSISRFADLWNSIHGPDAWDANPWVVAVSFTVRKGNIDDA